jgi:hypothetical protein
VIPEQEVDMRRRADDVFGAARPDTTKGNIGLDADRLKAGSRTRDCSR